MSQILDGSGCFYLKITGYGNLIGEWMHGPHADMQLVSTMSAKVVSHDAAFPDEPLAGSYHSVLQDGVSECFATLEIQPLSSDGRPRLFALTWTDSHRGGLYKGRGMLCDDVIIGTIWEWI